MTSTRAFELIDHYARTQHRCFLAEMFLNRDKAEYSLCFRPTQVANDRYACRYLWIETSEVSTLDQERELNEGIKALLDKELTTLNSSFDPS